MSIARKWFSNLFSEPTYIKECNRHPCDTVTYRWDVSPTWSPCSATCGNNGMQHQLFHCLHVAGSRETKVDERFCSDLASPKGERPCNRFPCVTYSWDATDDWGVCNETCGEWGTQTRRMACRKYLGTQTHSLVADSYCTARKSDSESRECNRRACYSLQWITNGDWTSCTQTCGTGATREKVVLCKNITYDNREQVLPPRFCKAQDRPSITEPCKLEPCEGFSWEPTNGWTNCTKPCGELGVEEKVYACVSSRTGNHVSSDLCGDSVIIETRECNRFPCTTHKWEMTDKWTPPCRQSCDDDVTVDHQTRETHCVQLYLNGQTEVTDDFFCNHLPRVPEIRECRALVCDEYKWIYDDWTRCNATCQTDGVETRVPVCVRNGEGKQNVTVASHNCDAASRPPTSYRPCFPDNCYRWMNYAII